MQIKSIYEYTVIGRCNCNHCKCGKSCSVISVASTDKRRANEILNFYDFSPVKEIQSLIGEIKYNNYSQFIFLN